MKRLVSIIIMLCVAITLSSTVNAYVGNDIDYVLKSYGYSSGTQTKVLNIYTDSTPVAGDLVTIYSYTGDNTQIWRLHSNVDYGLNLAATVRVLSKAASALALNYHQTTTKCTVYPFANNDIEDFPCYFDEDTSENGYVIWLVYRSQRYLGNSASSNGAQCYWYIIGQSGIHDEDVWNPIYPT